MEMMKTWRNEYAPMMIQRLDQRGRILKCDFDYQDELRFWFWSQKMNPGCQNYVRCQNFI